LKNIRLAAKNFQSYFFSGAAGAAGASAAAGAAASAGLAASAAGAVEVAGASAFFSQAATAVIARRAARRIEYFFMINTLPYV
jgi:hypothetical protein